MGTAVSYHAIAGHDASIRKRCVISSVSYVGSTVQCSLLPPRRSPSPSMPWAVTMARKKSSRRQPLCRSKKRPGERPCTSSSSGCLRLSALLYELRHDAERIAIHHAKAVGMDESPQSALDSKPDASIAVAARLCAEGLADALVSAGNTGASVLACQRFASAATRACAAARWPRSTPPDATRRKDDPFSMLLDVGATLDVTAEDLCTFAVMGAGYASRISKNARPKVALLSNGAEAGKVPKKSSSLRSAIADVRHQLHRKRRRRRYSTRQRRRHQFCSGFVGNVVLKMLEASPRRSCGWPATPKEADVASRPGHAVGRHPGGSKS